MTAKLNSKLAPVTAITWTCRIFVLQVSYRTKLWLVQTMLCRPYLIPSTKLRLSSYFLGLFDWPNAKSDTVYGAGLQHITGKLIINHDWSIFGSLQHYGIRIGLTIEKHKSERSSNALTILVWFMEDQTTHCWSKIVLQANKMPKGMA